MVPKEMAATCARRQTLTWLSRRLIDAGKASRIIKAAERIHGKSPWRDLFILIESSMVNARTVEDARVALYLYDEFAVGMPFQAFLKLAVECLGMCRRISWKDGEVAMSGRIARMSPPK